MSDKMTIEETINGLQSMIQSKKFIEHDFDGVVDEDVCERAIELLKEQEFEEDETESSVRQEDVGTIMNLIEKALRKTNYQTVGYDNTCIWLQVFIDRR